MHVIECVDADGETTWWNGTWWTDNPVEAEAYTSDDALESALDDARASGQPDLMPNGTIRTAEASHVLSIREP